MGFLNDEKDLNNLVNGIDKMKHFMKGLYFINTLKYTDKYEFVKNNCVTTFHTSGFIHLT